jgi:3,4-dihydroxy 2-butanone 4-phosphate synthase/GTP cyclohydrolase II
MKNTPPAPEIDRVERVARTHLPTMYGNFDIVGYRSLPDDAHHVALVAGEIESAHGVLARIHSECTTGDVFGSLRCDCAQQLHTALRMIADEGRGVVVYLDQEGRGIGLLNKLRAYELQDHGYDTVDANVALGLPVDTRDYRVGAAILSDLQVRSVRLLTNNPRKVQSLERAGLAVEVVPIHHAPNPHNSTYLETKFARLGHAPPR